MVDFQMTKLLKSKIFFLIILFFGIFGLAKISWADTHTAATCNLTSGISPTVLESYNAAADNDTVVIPPGDCIWGATLTITKPITLQGSGAGLTKLTHNAGNYVPIISIHPASGKETEFFRVTGFYFENTVFFLK